MSTPLVSVIARGNGSQSKALIIFTTPRGVSVKIDDHPADFGFTWNKVAMAFTNGGDQVFFSNPLVFAIIGGRTYSVPATDNEAKALCDHIFKG